MAFELIIENQTVIPPVEVNQIVVTNRVYRTYFEPNIERLHIKNWGFASWTKSDKCGDDIGVWHVKKKQAFDIKDLHEHYEASSSNYNVVGESHLEYYRLKHPDKFAILMACSEQNNECIDCFDDLRFTDSLAYYIKLANDPKKQLRCETCFIHETQK